MGVGNSLEAAYALRGTVPAGPFRLVGDGILAGDTAAAIDVRFDVLVREKTLVSFQHHFVRDPQKRFAAVRYEEKKDGAAAAAGAGDLLRLRITPTGGDPGAVYIPNGDGASAGGRIPEIDLPPG